jgi:hypothetical protein
MSVTYHVKIKKEYAEAILADLRKMKAVELIKEEQNEVPEWHIKEVLKRKKRTDKNPSLLVDESAILSILNVD